jgi:hypothetical protein
MIHHPGGALTISALCPEIRAFLFEESNHEKTFDRNNGGSEA